MKILLTSPAFLPRIGGLELAVALLAEDLTALGHDVVVATKAEAAGPDALPFRVARRPGPVALLRWTRWCDVFFQANVSLKMLWPLLLVRRPWVVSHHSWYRRADGRVAWQDRLKRALLRHATSIAVSDSVAADLGVPATVIVNAYDERLFRELPGIARTRELIFVGRLVTDKGVDVLLDALARLAAEGVRPRLTIVGDGPELPALRAQAAAHGLVAQVDFLGTRMGEELVGLLNAHRLLVVPSRYDEPFGKVAIEGIACGCVVIGSARGGLAAAIGPCGRTFPNGDSSALAALLLEFLRAPELDAPLRAGAPSHLARHSRAAAARAYANVLERARGASHA